MDYSQIQALRVLSAFGLSSAAGRSVTSAIAKAKLPDPNFNQDAAINNLGQNAFLPRLENHIQDYNSGHGDRSRDVAAQLSRESNYNANTLSPNQARTYNAYLSGLSYGNGARFINGINTVVRSMQDFEVAQGSKLSKLA